MLKIKNYYGKRIFVYLVFKVFNKIDILRVEGKKYSKGFLKSKLKRMLLELKR